MLNYSTLEQELTDRLNAFFVSKELEGMIESVREPENDSELNRLLQDFTKTKVVVKYLNSDYTDTESNTHAVVEEKITFCCMVISNNLHKPAGLYSTFNLLKLCLVGYTPQDANKSILPVKIAVEEHANLGLVNMHVFKTATIVPQAFDLTEIPVAAFSRLTSIFYPLTPTSLKNE